jgi:hypothetical protein
MKDKKCFLIIRDRSFYFVTNESSSIYQYNFDTLESIPGIYCFQNLYEKLSANAKALKDWMIENNLFNKSKISGKYYLKEIFVAIPDDLQLIEKRFLEEFLFTTIKSSVDVKFISENMLVTTGVKEYICLYKTCRMVVISFISNNEVKAKLSLERKDYTEAELKYFIDNIHYDIKGKNFQVYLIGYETTEYPSSIGQGVNYDIILRNFVQITKPSL